jgi:hypothetical protein
MRPYVVLCAFTLVAVSALGQQPGPHPYIPGLYGQFAPLVSTPMVSLQTVSPNPVGASNATTGLVAGATNSTVSQIEGSTSSSYTEAVWYQGGAPLVAPEVNLFPEPLGHGMHAHRGMMMEEHGMMEEREGHHEARAAWTYFSGPEYTTGVAGAAKNGPSKHSYTNDDVTRQNNNNGNVHYDSKTEKIQ